ncbi:hypothetical protein J4Q44_G00350560 [Coregonus suidteri]|uniref:Uncharacterized protein n=1 Tax=Coregonus suidteri TaxID=861788 RepID=A0AAN8KSJ5_9TELE
MPQRYSYQRRKASTAAARRMERRGRDSGKSNTTNASHSHRHRSNKLAMLSRRTQEEYEEVLQYQGEQYLEDVCNEGVGRGGSGPADGRIAATRRRTKEPSQCGAREERRRGGTQEQLPSAYRQACTLLTDSVLNGQCQDRGGEAGQELPMLLRTEGEGGRQAASRNSQ